MSDDRRYGPRRLASLLSNDIELPAEHGNVWIQALTADSRSVGPGMLWALRRAGVAALADLAALEPAALAARLGPLGRAVPALAWIATAVPPSPATSAASFSASAADAP